MADREWRCRYQEHDRRIGILIAVGELVGISAALFVL